MQWINDFKVALINHKTERIATLLDEIPEFQNQQEAKEALALIAQANTLLSELKQEASVEMNKIRKTKAFIKSL